MSRASAARTSDPVDGPSWATLGKRDQLLQLACEKSNGGSPGSAGSFAGSPLAGRSSAGKQVMQQLEREIARRFCDLLFFVFVDDVVLPRQPLPLRVLPKTTFAPVSCCSSIATCSRT